MIELQASKATRALKQYDALWKRTATSISGYAASIEADANRVVAATQRMASTVANAPRSGRSGSGAGRGSEGGGPGDIARIRNALVTKGPRKGGDELDNATAAANKAEAAKSAALARQAALSSGLAAGAVPVREAANALGMLATKSEKAKAAVRDLEDQVAHNRREMAALRVQITQTGDADGTLTERMRGLAVATGRANIQLSDARSELRGISGGLIDAINNAGRFNLSLSTLTVTAGNLISAGVSRAFREIAGGIVGATEKAIKFESSFADVRKVLPDNMTQAQVAKLEAGLLKLGPAVGVLPTQLSELTASLAQSGIASDQLLGVAEDASKVGVAFDLSGKEAGHAFASIQAALGTTRGETNSLFDTINELSNGMNSTARDLVDVEQRVGSVGRAMSLSGETVAALGSALVSTGAASDVAATGVRTFLARLGAGAAATPKQLAAFQALGLSATETAAALSSGDMQTAEGTIRRVVAAIQALPNEDRLPVLIELFGSESIGTIGALATNVELLGKAFEISGNKTKAAGSVLREYDNRSKTTEHQLARVKAGVEVLAIQFGNALLPSITEVANYLNSPEGQEWGRSAVNDLVEGVRSLVAGLRTVWPIVKDVGKAIASFSELVGGGTLAVTALAGGLFALGGPLVAVPVLAVAAGAIIGQAFYDAAKAFSSAKKNWEDMGQSVLEGRGVFGKLTDTLGELTASTDRSTAAWAAWMRQMLGVADAVDDFYDREREAKIRAGRISEAEARKSAVDADRIAYAKRSRAAKEANDAAIVQRRRGGAASLAAHNRFEVLSARVASGEKLSPSESKEYTALSNGLDRAKVSRVRGGGHRETELDRELAGMDPAVRALITASGEKDAGGHRKVADNVLDRAVFASATGRGGGGGGSVGPGPNVTTVYNDNKQIITVQVDASSSAPAAENIRRAASDLATSASNVRFVGASKVIANRNAGGRM